MKITHKITDNERIAQAYFRLARIAARKGITSIKEKISDKEIIFECK